MSRLRWDGADLRQIQLISVKLFDDAFSVNRVRSLSVYFALSDECADMACLGLGRTGFLLALHWRLPAYFERLCTQAS